MRNFNFWGVFKGSAHYHLYVIQFALFAYAFLRFSSRDYSIYGLLPPDYFNYPREFNLELWPVPFSEFSTMQFIHRVLPRIGAEGIRLIQYVICAVSLFGVFGILPRLSALLVFLLGAHLTGFMVASNAEVDAGCLLLMSMLALACNRKGVLYSTLSSSDKPDPGLQNFGVFLFLFVVSAYYFFTGVSKFIDVGPQLPFTLHLEWHAEQRLRDLIVVSTRYAHPEFLVLIRDNPWLSIVGGAATLIGEIGLVTVLFRHWIRNFFILNMAAFHVIVFYSTGINFLGNIAILLACLDWNAIILRLKGCFDRSKLRANSVANLLIS